MGGCFVHPNRGQVKLPNSVILSAAKDLAAHEARSFAALRMTGLSFLPPLGHPRLMGSFT